MPVTSRLVASLLLVLACAPAQAFSTRVHIWFANKIRAALIASGDHSIPLVGSTQHIILEPDDASAIISEPEAFRAGAVGPDNLMFPGQTDGTHAIKQRPYEQCEALYEDALLASERAYALGCFLHGSTDAIAHHYVNFMAGETFTLTPLTAARATDFTNVIRHIVAEMAIQDGVLESDPQGFTASELAHELPYGMILRNYFNTDGNVYSILGHHEVAEFAEVKRRNPDKKLPGLITTTEFSLVQHLISIAVYVAEAQGYVLDIRDKLAAELRDYQDPKTQTGAQLGVKPGPDGRIGTLDDTTSCAGACPGAYAAYMVRVALFMPRKDAWGVELPSAFAVLREKLLEDLDRFPLALLQTIENFSRKLNSPLTTTPETYDIEAAEVDGLLTPMTSWASDLLNIDYKALTYSIVPNAILKIDSLLSVLGLDVASVIKGALTPILQPIVEAIKAVIIQSVKSFLNDLLTRLKLQIVPLQLEFQNRLMSASAQSLGGKHALDHWQQSGFFAHAFNITAATLANHDVIIPFGEDDIGIGPASFDTSFTADWSQAGLCPELREIIFPYGLGMKGLLTVDLAGTVHPAVLTADSPVECHDGSLSAFTGNPSATNCAHTTLEALQSTRRGSLTRGYPPRFGAIQPRCETIVIPGLELASSGGALTASPIDPSKAPGDEVADLTLGGDAGCGAGGAGGLGWAALAVGLVLALRRRGPWPKARRAALGPAVATLFLAACDGTFAPDHETPNAERLMVPTERRQIISFVPASFDEGGTGAVSGALTAQDLVNALGDSTWHGIQNRYEAGVLTSRAYEMRFRAGDKGWFEIRNPFGPGRHERFRGFEVQPDGRRVESLVIQLRDAPFEELNGLEETWYFEVIAGNPRKLRIYGRDYSEEFKEGAFPTPTTGLTAVVRAFPTGPIENAFCTSGLLPIAHKTLFEWARGNDEYCLVPFCSTIRPLDEDAAMGVFLMSQWDDTDNNQFAVTNVNGFENFGGTALANQFNFVIWYRGWVVHPGGGIQIRELDDKVEDGAWVYLGDTVGSSRKADLFFEVHGFVTADSTPDEPLAVHPAGLVPIEIFIVRCANAIKTVELDMKLGMGSWKKVGLQPTRPELLDEYFAPPVFP